jgi:hypothetical protein
MKNLLFWVILTALAFSSCTMQKRVYSSGFHFEWGSGMGHASKQQKNSSPRILNKPNAATARIDVGTNNTTTKNEILNPEIRSEVTQTNVEKLQIHRVYDGTLLPQNQTSLAFNKKKRLDQHNQYNVHQQNRQRQQKQRNLSGPGDPLELILFILGIVAAIFGYDSWSGGGGGGGGWGGGSYFDWTSFFAITGAIIAALGLILTIALATSLRSGNAIGMMLFFTILGTIFSGIGLIKAIRDYYDFEKYLSIGAFVLMAAMWIIGMALI